MMTFVVRKFLITFFAILASSLFFSIATQGQEIAAAIESTNPNACMARHLREAIELNRLRREQYDILTNGKSRSLSNLLILSEKVALLYAKSFDRKAQKYQSQGIPVLCEEFVPIVHKPIQFYPEQNEDLFSLGFSRKELSKDLRTELAKRDWSGLEKKTERYLQSIEGKPRYYCMIRHVLESMRRSAGLALIYKSQAENRWGKNSAAVEELESLLESFNRKQIMAFNLSFHLDKHLFPIQKSGVGMLCSELPVIPKAPHE